MFVLELIFIAFVLGLFAHAQSTLQCSNALGINVEIFVSNTEGLINVSLHLWVFRALGLGEVVQREQ